MKRIANDEMLKTVIKENQELKYQAFKAKSDIDYIAMMTDVEIETEEVDSNEQIRKGEELL